MNHQHITKTAAETEKLALALLLDILNNKVVLLSGQLGSGKTTFVKGLAKALKISQLIKSPTYTYLNTYQLPTLNSQLRTLHHFDLYRLPDWKAGLPEHSEHPEQVAASIGLTEAIKDPSALVVIEWPERLPIPKPYLHLTFEKRGSFHTITILSLPIHPEAV